MINPLASIRLPRHGLSPQALLTAAVAHVLVFWWVLHGGQAVQATRQVVYQTLSPITPPREKPVAIEASPAPLPAIAPPPVLPALPAKLLAAPEPVVPVVPEATPVAEATAPALVLSPAAGPARSSAITPKETPSPAAPAGDGPAGNVAIPPAASGTAVPGGTGTNYAIPDGGRKRQKSVAEMANEQLNPGGRKDRFAAAVDASERPDCANSGQAAGLLAPAIVAYNVVRDKCK